MPRPRARSLCSGDRALYRRGLNRHRRPNGAAIVLENGPSMLNLAINRFCRFLEILLAVFMAIMVVMVFGNVVLRYGFNSGIIVSEELSRWLFIWVDRKSTRLNSSH